MQSTKQSAVFDPPTPLPQCNKSCSVDLHASSGAIFSKGKYCTLDDYENQSMIQQFHLIWLHAIIG